MAGHGLRNDFVCRTCIMETFWEYIVFGKLLVVLGGPADVSCQNRPKRAWKPHVFPLHLVTSRELGHANVYSMISEFCQISVLQHKDESSLARGRLVGE